MISDLNNYELSLIDTACFTFIDKYNSINKKAFGPISLRSKLPKISIISSLISCTKHRHSITPMTIRYTGIQGIGLAHPSNTYPFTMR